MARKITNNKGFTLLELVITMMLIAALSAIAMTKFGNVRDIQELDEDMHLISSFLKSKRLQAFTTKEAINITLNAAGTTFTAISDPSGTASDAGSIETSNSFAPASSTFSINDRGLYTTTGNIRFTNNTFGGAYSCIAIDNARLRFGVTNGTNCN